MSMDTTEFEFVTDTSTLCVFDVKALRHRIDDDCDWWSDPDHELEEMNKGNVAFVGLGSDGKFSIELSDRLVHGVDDVVVVLYCPSGRLFVGAGEEVTAEGLEPEAIRGGRFLSVEPGTYLLRVRRIGSYRIAICLAPHDGRAMNSFDVPVRV